MAPGGADRLFLSNAPFATGTCAYQAASPAESRAPAQAPTRVISLGREDPAGLTAGLAI